MRKLKRINLSRKQGGLGGLNYPLLSDFSKNIAKDYGVLIENDGVALRGKIVFNFINQSYTTSLNLLNFHRSISD